MFQKNLLFKLGVLALLLTITVVFFVYFPGAEEYDVDDSVVNAWSYITLVFGLFFMGGIFFFKKNDEYFDKEDLLPMIPGVWFLFDASLCFLRAEHTRDWTAWLAVTFMACAALVVVYFFLMTTRRNIDKYLSILTALLVILMFNLWRDRFFLISLPANVMFGGVALVITIFSAVMFLLEPEHD